MTAVREWREGGGSCNPEGGKHGRSCLNCRMAGPIRYQQVGAGGDMRICLCDINASIIKHVVMKLLENRSVPDVDHWNQTDKLVPCKTLIYFNLSLIFTALFSSSMDALLASLMNKMYSSTIHCHLSQFSLVVKSSCRVLQSVAEQVN